MCGCVHSLEIIVQLNNLHLYTSSEPSVLENLPVVFETWSISKNEDPLFQMLSGK